MKIVYIASEIAPYAKTGGLADVAGSLPLEIQEIGHEVCAFLPRYKSVSVDEEGCETVISKLAVPVGNEREEARVYAATHESGVRFYFIDQPELFCRDELYGTALGDYPDNDHRFIFFQRAVLETLKALKIKADILHCHDWQTGLIPVYLKTLYARDLVFRKTKTVFTIHNLAYQGNFPPDSLPATGLGWDQFHLDKLEFYGKVNFLKGGIVYADAITTVSRRYAEEIQTKEYGCGLEGVLSRRADVLTGIVNGLDYHEWNPETDQELKTNYSLKDLSGKAKNKAALQAENELEVNPDIPLFGLVSRLVDQKGIDILIAILDEMASLGAQLVVLGTGEEKYHQILRDVGKQYRKQFGIHIVFDAAMANRIYGGCDILLIPSYYEPCGLAQMIGLRYGAVPLVRSTGGLADTIHEYDAAKGIGNGFCFEDYTGRAMMAAVKRSLQAFANKDGWRRLVENAMGCDFSWRSSAAKFVELYEHVEKQSIRNTK